MRNVFFNLKNPVVRVACLLFAFLSLSTRLNAIEDPPNCSLANGGAGNTSQGGINFNLAQAHVGDTVPVFPNLGMANNACKAINATGTVYIATGQLTNFLVDVTLDPGVLVSCPANGLCESGPYNITITPALVGAAVSTPLGGVPGVAKTVRALETGFGTVLAGDVNEQLSDLHSASIQIVTPCIQVFKECDFLQGQECFAPETPVKFRGYVTNCGDITLTNVVVIDNRAGQMLLLNPTNGLPLAQPVTLAPRAVARFSSSFQPTLEETCAGSATNVVTATGTDITVIGGPRASVTNSYTDVCPICTFPAITVTKECPSAPVQPGEALVYSGVVSNAGNITLTNVTVVNNQPENGTPVLGPITLPPGASMAFTNSYTVPLDSCGPYVDTLTARANTTCGLSVTNFATATCAGTNTPSIDVSKACPANPVQPGGLMVVSGTVTNTGNITLTNVVVTNSINALEISRRVLGPITLAPGAGTTFSDSYTVPLDSCGPYSDTFTASGADKCFGVVVDDFDTQACAGTNTPSINVTKACPTNPVQPGGLMVVSGTVTNTGNITLTNVVVTNSINALEISRRVLGPITLAPGEGTSFSDSYTVPLDSCGPYVDTLTARANTTCGLSVTNFATATCAGTNTPSIDVSKACPANPVQPGGLMVVSGTVTNTGNITLTNVVVTNSINALEISRRVLGPITLAPGAGTTFSDSYTVPLDSCGPYSDTFTASGADKCFGVVVDDFDTQACAGTNTPSINVTKACPTNPVQPGGLMVVSGTVTNTGNITLTNVVVTNSINALEISRRVLGPITLAPGEGTSFSDSYTVPLDSCGPYSDTFTASGADKCFGVIVTDFDTQACAGTNTPSIDVTKACPANPVQPGGLMLVTGTVTNTGNITLTNVVVTNSINALEISRRVLGPITLAPGEGTSFSDSYTVPLDSCGPYSDTFTASGADKCFGVIVTDFDTQACAGTNTPSIDVTKACPANPVQPGGLMLVTGTVTNTGNITLTNVVVTNSINVLGISRLVLGPITLAPGAGTTFSDSYTVPLDSCGPYSDTFTASGADKCFGVIVTDFDTKACAGTNSPRLTVIKRCPAVPTAPGQVTTISGVVSNAGNVTLTNILVFDDQPAPNTLLLGPISLAPGESAGFTNSYQLPANCCTYVDTINASGKDKCFGRTVTASATAACPTATDPRITVTKTCPPLPVPLGQPLIFSGTVSNAGNITLTNVTVVNNQPSNNAPVFGPITLAPGETASFTGSYVVPSDICDTNILDTLTARANNLCNGGSVSATHSALCPILPTPRLVVTKNCPLNPVPPGGLLEFSGTVSNAGSITLTNVIVVNDHPTNNTPVLGPITLAPGQSTNFSGSYYVCPECCPPYVDTLTAVGAQICNGSNTTATATAYCPGITTPKLDITVDYLSDPVLQGEQLFYSGIVSNAGDVTVGDIVIADDKEGHVADIFALAPGETADFFGAFVPTNCGTEFSIMVTGAAFDVCTGGSVSNQVTAYAVVLCSKQGPVLVAQPPSEGDFVFSLLTEQGLKYTVEFTPSLSPPNWQTLTNFVGNGGVVTIHDPISTDQHRFYRVLVE